MPETRDSETHGGNLDVTALEAAVLGRIAGERGPIAALRGLPRAARFALLLALVAVETALILAFLRRFDLDRYPAARMTVAVAGYGALLVASAWLALRPLYLPDRPLARRALIAFGLALPIVLAVLPEVQNGVPPAGAGRQARLALTCFADGVLVAAAFLLAGRLLDRGGPGALLIAIAAGLTAALLLHLHCAFTGTLHLLVGHATVPVASIAGGLWLERRPP